MELDTLRFLLAIARTNVSDRADEANQKQGRASLSQVATQAEELQRQAFERGREAAYRDVAGTLDRLIALTDGRPF